MSAHDRPREPSRAGLRALVARRMQRRVVRDGLSPDQPIGPILRHIRQTEPGRASWPGCTITTRWPASWDWPGGGYTLISTTQRILQKAVDGRRLTFDEGVALLDSHDLPALGRAADAVCRRLHPEPFRTYNIDRNINYTNVCAAVCDFCAFYRKSTDADAYLLPREEIYKKIEETIALGGDQTLMQGGLHPSLKLEWYEDLLRSEGALDRSYRLPMGERPGREALAIHQADLLIHGWDLAEATHQDASMDPELAGFALETERWFVQPEMRGPNRAYATALPDSTARDDEERLLALVGRRAQWR